MDIDGDLLSRRRCRQFPKCSLPAEGLTFCKALIFCIAV
nr:MAG TPA: Nuclear polyadenylated RNA-binding 2 protein CCCH zinc finger 1 [Caudoviricetes sp.]